ncbi:hypothetical protein HP550_20325 [Cellulomonas humilata]|uniref:Baseplate protein J-like domain-containing protein n=1 Tax=Cellulomonas humilata TaxID=144055 RepID=A0A7Y6DZW7_9CELL|nr:baseplate J/gp47 family protein [Cellulomonas humilata]NUU19597.1 hypothetical protein [Cellulomonas humilata]
MSHSAILERMLDRVAQAGTAGGRPLARLGTRSTEDPAIALLSATAGAAHVLAWNVHRSFRDSTLDGTRDRAALVSLTGLLGHVPRPAISATTVLAFELDTFPGSPSSVTVPRGTQVASVPGQGEVPVTFETDRELRARSAWNTLAPVRAPAPVTMTTSTAQVAVAGSSTGVRVGDSVLVVGRRTGTTVTWIHARVTRVETDLVGTPPVTTLFLAGQREVKADTGVTGPVPDGTVIVLGTHARPFGAAAPDFRLMPKELTGLGTPTPNPTEWSGFTVGKVTGDPTAKVWTIHLDGIHPGAAAGRVVVLEGGSDGTALAVERITAAREATRSDFTLSLACTVITVGADHAAKFDTAVRQTVLLVETSRHDLLVPLADPDLPLTDPATSVRQHPALAGENRADRIWVHGEVPLEPGRHVVLVGRGSGGAKVVEVGTVLRTSTTPATAGTDVPAGGATLVVLDGPLSGRWRASSLTILANAVPASQGQTPVRGPETIGSGDPAQRWQRFRVTRGSLAHVPAPGAPGYAPAVDVRVDGRRYEAVASLLDEGPESRAYRVVERRDAGSDVQMAGRLPSGTGNVTALFRTGGGGAGNLPPDRLTQVMAPVPGIRTVTNPVPADGGNDPESVADLRSAAPRAIRTLGRAVSLEDFQSFAEQYRGIGKASADELRAGTRRIVCLTVATTSLAPPTAGSSLVRDLRDALLAAAPPGTHVRVEGFVDLPVSLVLELRVDPAVHRSEVESAVRGALERRFGRSAMGFGRAIHRSEVLATVQGVPGVVAARLTSLSAPGVVEDAQGRLPSGGPRLIGGVFEPARLLSVQGAALTLTEMTT